MDIFASRDSITNRTGYAIDNSTFKILDKEQCMWIARVTTTHNSKHGDPELSFSILVTFREYLILEDKHIPILSDWCLKHAPKGENNQ